VSWLDDNTTAQKDEFESQQKELEGVANPIMMKFYGAGGEVSCNPLSNPPYQVLTCISRAAVCQECQECQVAHQAASQVLVVLLTVVATTAQPLRRSTKQFLLPRQIPEDF